MLSPGAPGPERPLPKSLVVPDTIEEITESEPSADESATAKLTEHILKLGVASNSNIRQFHSTYVEDRQERLVAIWNRLQGGIGRVLHVIVNDTIKGIDGSLRINSREFVMATRIVRLAVSRSEFVDNENDGQWHIRSTQGPLLLAHSGRVEIMRGRANGIPLPTDCDRSSPFGVVDLMYQRAHKEELADVFSSLGPASLEPDARLPKSPIK